MNEYFKLILSMSLSGSALILILAVLKPIWKERFSKAWQYYIWMIVLIRLLIPFTPEFSLTNDLFHTKLISSAALTVSDTASPDNNGTAVHEAGSGNEAAEQQNNSGPAIPGNTTVRNSAALPDRWDIAGLLWLAGVLLILSVKAMQYIWFSCLIRIGAEPVADSRILLLYRKILGELRLHKGPRLMYSGRIPSPMLAGMLKPSVYLNDTAIRMNEEKLSYVLKHELLHYKRHDLWYKWCCDLAISIHWFNPFVYVMSRRVNSLCEISCDEAITKDLNHEEKLIYGNMLINAAADNMNYRKHILSTTLYEDKKSLKERILTIMTTKRRTKRTVIISITAGLLLCTAAFMLGAYTARGADQPDIAAADNRQETTGAPEDNTSPADGSLAAAEDPDHTADVSGPAADNTAAASENTADTSDTTGKAADNAAVPADGTGNSSSDTGALEGSAGSGNSNSVQLTGTPAPAGQSDSILYHNDQYGFEITLPASWEGFTVQEEDWQGIAYEGEQQGQVVEAGKTLIIRHPEWTSDNPRQDIPIMVYTPEQWKKVENEEISVSAAPIIPTKLTSNSDYVFALPARYNYAFLNGYEEVEKIISDNFFQ